MSPLPSVSEVFVRVRTHLVRRTRHTAMLWAVVGGLAVLLTAWLLAGAEGWATGTWGPLLLDLALLLMAGGAWWGVRRLRRHWLSERRVAGSMEEAAGMGQGTVLGALEIGRDLPPGVSGSLARVAEQGVARGLGLPEDELAGRLAGDVSRWSRRGFRTLAVLAPAVAVLLILTPGRTITAWSGLGTPFRLLAAPVLPALEVRPGDVEVLRGEDVEIRVGAPGRAEVELHWQAAGDVARTTVEPVSGEAARFTLEAVRAPVEYHVRAADGARSGTYRVTPVDPLLVSDVTVELVFPDYTARAPEEYEGDPPPLTVPVGTRLRIEGRASRSLATARLVDGDGEEAVEMVVEGPLFRSTWRPTRSGVYRWDFSDEEGGAAEVTPTPLDLTLVGDSVPEVIISFPGRDTILPLTLRQPLVLEARDDYGVETLELVAYRVTSLGERQEPRVQSLELGASRGVQARPVLDLSGWGLLPGDTVRYFGRVVDNGPAAQSDTTPEYVLRMPGAAEMRRDAQHRLEDAGQVVEDLAERAAESARETRDLERRTASGGDDRAQRSPPSRSGPPRSDERASFQEREDVGQALDRQSDLQAAVDSVRDELRTMAEAMEDAGVSDPELSRELEELQEMLEDALTPEMRETLREMMERLDEMDLRQAAQTLEDLGEQQEAMRQRLEESLERFRRAAVEQDFRATTEEAQELAREEQALAEAMREDEDPRSRADQQDELQERTEEMDERMERLEERLQELGEEDAAQEVRAARERSEEAREHMARASQQARQGEGEQAGEQAEQAARQMDETARELEEARQQQAREQAEAAERALRQAADDALSLARRQSDLGEEMGSAGRERLAELRADVAAVQQGVRNMVENLAVNGATAGGADRALSTLTGEAIGALERTVEAMESQPGPAPSPSAASDDAVAALNQVAMGALSGAEQAAQGQQGQGQPDMQEMMESLAQQQGQLNNQAGQVMPMQLGQQAMRSQMQQLSRGQQSVADELGQLAEQSGGDEALGDLEALAREAEELARELAGGRLEAPTRERQERLFHRLLDAGRSLEKDEYSEERESRAPGAFERGQVLPLGPDALDAVRFRLPPTGALQRLSPAERRLVIQYFERLNRERREDGAGVPPAPDGGTGG